MVLGVGTEAFRDLGFRASVSGPGVEVEGL